MKLTDYTSDTGPTTLFGVDGDPITDPFDTVDLNYPFSNWGDNIQPSSEDATIFTNDNGAPGCIRSNNPSDPFKTVFFADPFEAIYNANTANGEEVCSQVLDWLKETEEKPISITVASPQERGKVTGTSLVQVGTSVSSDNVTNVNLSIDNQGWIDITNNYNPENGLYEYSWDTTVISDGMHSLVAKVETTAGNATSSTIHGLVDNIASEILLIDDDGGADYESYYVQALGDLGYSQGTDYDVWNVSVGGVPEISLMKSFQKVIWFTGTIANPLAQNETLVLTKYLDQGGRLFFDSQGMGDTAFVNKYLHVDVLANDVGIDAVDAVDALGGNYSVASYSLTGGTGAGNNNAPSGLTSFSGGKREMIYSGTSYGATVSYAGVWKSVMFGFPFEAIDAATDRMTVMEETLDFLNTTGDECSLSLSLSPASGRYNSSITLEGDLKNASGGIGNQNVSFFIRKSNHWVKLGRNTTASTGEVELSLKLSMKRSAYPIAVVHYGIDSSYERSVGFATLTVKGMETKLQDITLPSEKLDSGWKIQGNLTDASDHPLSDREVNVETEKRIFTGNTRDNGFFDISVSAPPGTYDLSIAFNGDAKYAPVEEIHEVTISDDDTMGPTLQLGAYPSNISYNKKFSLHANISDPSGVNSAIFLYNTNTSSWQEVSMEYTRGTRWEIVIPKGTFEYGENITWEIRSFDMDSDWGGDSAQSSTNPQELQIIDETPPNILGMSIQPFEPTSEEIIRVVSDVSEPATAAGIDQVQVQWKSETGTTGTVETNIQNGLYVGKIKNPPAGELDVTLKAYDNAGNVQTKTLSIQVQETPEKTIFEKNPWLAFLIVGGVIGGGAIIAGGIYWKRRKQEKKLATE